MLKITPRYPLLDSYVSLLTDPKSFFFPGDLRYYCLFDTPAEPLSCLLRSYEIIIPLYNL